MTGFKTEYQFNFVYDWDGKLEYTELEEGLKKERKKGWGQCGSCGVAMGYNWLSVKDHGKLIEGLDCD